MNRQKTWNLHSCTLSQKVTAWLLLVSMLFSLWLPIYADTTKIGTVINVENTTLNIRSGPGTSYGVVGTLKQGDQVSILGFANDANGVAWYQISFSNISGYVHSYYISVSEMVTPPNTDEAFEAYLTEQGFPESYKIKLREIHKQYPTWVFNAFHTNLEWETVLNEESKLGRNLVPSTSLNSWKSMEKGAYNWNNGTWYGLDGAAWVAASREIIAYYLDPRNALDTTAIFQFESLSYSPYHTASGVNTILKNTFMSGSYTTPDTKKTYTYTETFMQAGSITGVSPYHLASRARQEQGVNGTALSLGTVPGYKNYFNFFNVGAYATSSASAHVNGAIYASTTNTAYYLPWTNQYKSILGGAAVLASGYISKQQDTLYLQKFDVVNGGNGYYFHQYMTNVVAPTSEATSLKKAYTDEMLNSTFVFNIPVYLNMPETAVAKPTSSGDNNNFLSTLSVAEHTLTPSFNMYNMQYELVVSTETDTITVKATPKGSKATVAGTGKISLKPGENNIEIAVTAASGAVRIYTLSVYRIPGTNQPEQPEVPDEPEIPKEPTFSISSETYVIGTYITGIEPRTDAETFLQQIKIENCTAKLSDEKIGTGVKLELYDADNMLLASYPLLIYGDINGDGKISAMDLLAMQKHLLKMVFLEGDYLSAADLNNSDTVSAIDLLALQKHLLKMTTISQRDVA